MSQSLKRTDTSFRIYRIICSREELQEMGWVRYKAEEMEQNWATGCLGFVWLSVRDRLMAGGTWIWGGWHLGHLQVPVIMLFPMNLKLGRLRTAELEGCSKELGVNSYLDHQHIILPFILKTASITLCFLFLGPCPARQKKTTMN